MGNAEEIAGYKEIIDGLTEFDEAYREKHAKELLNLVLQAHTNQTLQELKEKVNKKIEYQSDVVLKDCKWMGYDHQQATCKIECYEEIITLIDEAINE